MKIYDHKKIETKWQKKWDEWNLYKTEDNSTKSKKYILDMFPYPSGAGLHVGHPEGYTATDIYSRYLRLNGYNVLHPMGWDAFGLPAENYAIKSGIHPATSTKNNINNFRRQIKSLGLGYDWSKELNTSDPQYYKWTQWFFLFFYKHGLAYKNKAKVNWCPSCQTVLANEQVANGACDRCGNEIIQKDMEQWFFKITDYAEQLLSGLDKIDWPEPIKAMQKNWIGKSKGSEIYFSVIIENEIEQSPSFNIKVFTTRPDTLFGATYLVLAPEHTLLYDLRDKINNWPEVERYIESTKKKSELQRTDLNKDKTGVELKGIKAINPANNKEVPIFIADYVLASYGTGAIMAVPAHDERDYEFANKFNLNIKYVIEPDYNTVNVNDLFFNSVLRKKYDLSVDECKIKVVKSQYSNLKRGEKTNAFCFSGSGNLINSGEFNGMNSEAAKIAIVEKIGGQVKVNYRLRDWLVSRQRYWGAPIPIIYCDKCKEVPVPEKDLPVVLPVDVDFRPTGESPLQRSATFHDVSCPYCGGPARRESDTMDTFVCSSWYYFRYVDSDNNQVFAAKEKIKQWLPVDLYVGGAEHAVLHLMYARFFTKILFDKGLIDFDEPFLKLKNQGMILAEDGRKMSKSLGNVINPDEVVENIGADAMRMYEMFMGPLDDAKPWSTRGIVGLRRFLEKVWSTGQTLQDIESSSALKILMHKTIKKVGQDIENMKFNTAISAMMIFINEVQKEKIMNSRDFESFLIILSPFAPHIAEELWEQFGHTESIFTQSWPSYKENLAQDEIIKIAVQVNGKLRETLDMSFNSSAEDVQASALLSVNTQKWLKDKKIIKIIFVKNKLINIVAQ